MDQYNGRNNADIEITTAHSGAVHGLMFTNDGHFLVSVGTDENMRLWNSATGSNMEFLKIHFLFCSINYILLGFALSFRAK